MIYPLALRLVASGALRVAGNRVLGGPENSSTPLVVPYCSDTTMRLETEHRHDHALRFGPAPGLPDYSPYVVKTMLLLNSPDSTLWSTRAVSARAQGQASLYLDDARIVADSTFIRWHIEQTRALRFRRGTVRAAARDRLGDREKMCEIISAGSCDGAVVRRCEFPERPRTRLRGVPALIRPFVRRHAAPGHRRATAGAWDRAAQGRGDCAARRKDVAALATLLGDKAWLFGDRPCGADATVFAMLLLLLHPASAGPNARRGAGMRNLVAYRDRVLATFFPDVAAG